MLELKHICKKFQDRVILDDISLKFPDYGLIGIQGESGCGKSTLLCILGMLDTCYDGEILYDGKEIHDSQAFIREHISFMMQNNDLISALTVKENILLAAQVSQKKYALKDLKEIMQRLEIDDYLSRYPDTLSGGQKKRVSLAKALLKKSDILLCDEPTGALHQQQEREVMELLKELSQECLVIVVSHNQKLLKEYSDALLVMDKGKLKGKLPTFKKERSHQQNHKYSLWFYSLRQCLYQKNKLVSLFIFQWIVIMAFFLIVTAFQGLSEAIYQSEITSVNVNQMTIEKKDGLPFLELPTLTNTKHINYQYHLEYFDTYVDHKKTEMLISLLPYTTSHIVLKQGRFPQNANEVLVSEGYMKESQKEIKIAYGDYEKDLKVVGVIQKDFFSQKCLYLHPTVTDELDDFKDDYTLVVESLSGQSQSLYQKLSQDYNVYSDVKERVESYQSVLTLSQNVAYVFIGVSLIVSLLFIGIVESIIYTERKKDIAYLLSLGLKKKQLYRLSLMEALFMAVMIGGVGGVHSLCLFYYVNSLFHLQQKIGFELILKPIFLMKYDLIVLIIFIYMLMVIVGIFFPTYQSSHVDVVEVMRGDSLC